MVNIASELSEEKLLEIGNRVAYGFQEDLSSQSEWLSDVKRVIELSTLKSHKKSTPLSNSANVKMPIITKACYEFSSRAYPEIINDGKLVKGRVLGYDIDGEKQKQADRVAEWMNYQLLFENEDWELETDRLLVLVALIGFICKKTYYDPIRKIIKSVLCDWEDLIINAEVKSLSDARRVTHVIHQHTSDLVSAKAAKVFLAAPIEELIELHKGDTLSKPNALLEQHCYLDLDGDNYEEPYIVTSLKETNKVVRIAPRYTEKSLEKDLKDSDNLAFITAIQLFTDYHFLVSPKGKFHSVGFGILMLHLNESINSVINQLLDSGQLANMQGGYIDADFKSISSGESTHSPGQWRKIKKSAGDSLKDGIFPLTYKEPSSVLFQLLGLLIQSAKDLSSSTEVMTGSASTDNAKTGAVSALIQEGKKLVTSIQRRIYRSLTQEFRKIFTLNSIYLNEKNYAVLLDTDLQVSKEDFNSDLINIIPVADPNLSSDVQRSTKIQTLMAVQSLPGIDHIKVSKRILATASIEKPEDLMLSDKEIDAQKNAPNPDAIKAQAEIADMSAHVKIKNRDIDVKEKQLMLDAYRAEAEIVKLKADSILALAKAEVEDKSISLDDYRLQLDILSKHIEAIQTERQSLSQPDTENPTEDPTEVPNDPTAGAGGNNPMAGDASNQDSISPTS